jgi:hypothetical protein
MPVLPDPKAWMLENVGPVPDHDNEEKYERWHTILGILLSYRYDAEHVLQQGETP